jgi:hypothetical protein
MTDPISLSFDVACTVEHAFSTWTAGFGTWWPADHTLTGTDDVVVVLQQHVGGRIFERTVSGVEHDWGEVTVWEPPTEFGYLWHLGRDSSDPTEVHIRFVARSNTTTRVEIEHHGWDRLGSAADEWRNRNRFGWDAVLPYFKAAAANRIDT